MKKRQQGFTLIELMIVVAIIGVLSSIAVPAYQDYIKKSEAAAALATMKALITPAELWAQENGSFNYADKVRIMKHIGVVSGANKLGTISIPQNNTLQFVFDQGGSISQGAKIEYIRNPATGWKCSHNTTVSLKSCS